MKTRHGKTDGVTTASAQGERSHQEDRAVCEWIETSAGTGWLLAVFDGHRGDASAVAASSALRALFEEHFVSQRGDAASALRNVFIALNELTHGYQAGSTASVVFVPADTKTATLAVLGDSPVAILDSEGKAYFGPDHNIRTNLHERAAAQMRGGVYYGGYLEDPQSPGVGLQMTRALGDADLSRILERNPEFEMVPLGEKGIVLVGSDGLFSPGGGPNAEQLKRLLVFIQQGAHAEAVVADALARRTGDNVTAIVWRKNQAAG